MIYVFLVDFDINQWYIVEGINFNVVLSFVDREKLFNKLGISFYFSVNFCFFFLDIYSLVNVKGWKNGQFYFLINIVIRFVF